jgi:hypothetical protein
MGVMSFGQRMTSCLIETWPLECERSGGAGVLSPAIQSGKSAAPSSGIAFNTF